MRRRTPPAPPAPRRRRAPDPGRHASLRYKVVEISSVTDEDLESVLNQWTAEGWTFEGVHFAMRESSKRPSMAFVTFTRQEADGS